jgi:hypothetical protein
MTFTPYRLSVSKGDNYFDFAIKTISLEQRLAPKFGFLDQGCQIFLCTIYQNGKIYSEKIYLSIRNGHKICQTTVK